MDDATRIVIRKHISDLHALKTSGPAVVPLQQPLMAEIQFILAEEQSKSADKFEQQTARLIDETVELRRLTRGLYFLTIAVAFFALVQIVIMVLEYCAKLHRSA